MPSDTIRNDRVRVLVLMKRKASLTREEFSKYWRKVHAPLFTSLNIVKTNVLRYEQGHTNTKYSDIARDKMGLVIPDFDGVLILDGESFDKVFAVFTSDEYQRVVAPDEEKFVDRPACRLLPLGLVTVIE
ncbi:hypothetical protein DXG01_009327 [Tephrocybe rancida]|nr:hypothetical protein DXG01_009327 [Tephrocybe rancida]